MSQSAESSPSPSSTPASNILSDELFVTPYDAVRKPISMHSLPKTVIIAPVSVEKALRCSICCRLYDKAQTSNVCSHSFCEHCITEYLRKGNKECPNCRMKLISRRSLRPNALLDGIVKAVFSNRAAFEERLETFSTLRGEGSSAPTTRSAAVFQNRNNLHADGDVADETDVNFESLCDEIMICLLPHPDMHAVGLAEACHILPERGISAPHFIAVEWRADLQPADIALTLLMPTKAWSGDRVSNDDAGGGRTDDTLQAIFKNAALRFAFASKTCLFTKNSKTSNGAGSSVNAGSAVFIPFTSMNGVTPTAGDDLLELYYLTPSLNDVHAEAAKFSNNTAELDRLMAANRIAGSTQTTEDNNNNIKNTGEKNACETGSETKTKREFRGNQWRKRDRSLRNSRNPSPDAPDETAAVNQAAPENGVVKKKRQYRRAVPYQQRGKCGFKECLTTAMLAKTRNDTVATAPLAFIFSPPAPAAAAAALPAPDADQQPATVKDDVILPQHEPDSIPPVSNDTVYEPSTLREAMDVVAAASSVENSASDDVSDDDDVDDVQPPPPAQQQPTSEAESKYPLDRPLKRHKAFMRMHGAAPVKKLWLEMKSCSAERFEHLLLTATPPFGKLGAAAKREADGTSAQWSAAAADRRAETASINRYKKARNWKRFSMPSC